MVFARSARLRALSKDRLVLNTLALLIHGQRGDDAYRFLERLSVTSRRRIEQALRAHRFIDNVADQAPPIDAVVAMMPKVHHRYEPIVPRQTRLLRLLKLSPIMAGGLLAVGAVTGGVLHHLGVGGGLAGMGMVSGALGLWPWGGNARFFDTVVHGGDLIEPAYADDAPVSLWALYTNLVAPIHAARRARQAALRSARSIVPTQETSSEATPARAPLQRMDQAAAQARLWQAMENAPPARLPTEIMTIEDRVALMEEHRKRLQTRVERQEGVALACKAVVEDFQELSQESSPERLTQAGGKSAGAPLVAYSLTRTLGTLMHHKPYLIKNGFKSTTVDTLTDGYIKTIRSTYAHLVRDKRYAMTYHMLAQGFTEWDLHVFRAIERCLKNNNPEAPEDLIDLERVLSGYNMDHCIKALPLMMLSIQGYALSLEMKSQQFPDNTTYATMAADVKRILKNLQQQIPEDVYLKSMDLVQANAPSPASSSSSS